MEESEEILLSSLANSGVPVPAGVSSVRDLTSPTLYAICSHAVRVVDRNTLSFPSTLPEDCESMADRVKACTDLASAFRNLGFIDDISFHKFLYPSKEDLYKLVRFLVSRLSESSGLGTDGDKSKKEDEGEECMQNEVVVTAMEDIRVRASEDRTTGSSDESNSILQIVETGVQEFRAIERDSSEMQLSSGGHGGYLSQSRGIESLEEDAFRDQDGFENAVSQNKEETLKAQVNAKSTELQHLEEELQLLKMAAEMICDSQHAIDFHIEQLSTQVDSKRLALKELDSEWDVMAKPLHEKKRNLEQSLKELYPEVYSEFTRAKEIELETQTISAEIKRREEELSKLSSDLARQPKLAPRRFHIERINEITKNSKKQDADIQRILKDTRELQLESNSIQERLNRTYAVVDETIFREAKKDVVARQAYRLLTSTHESFEQIAEKILATDKCRRDIADYEAKLAITSSRSLNVDKIQADLDAIRKENDLLEQHVCTL